MQKTPRLAIIAAVHARLVTVDRALGARPGDPALARSQRELEDWLSGLLRSQAAA
ncbi:MAG TPA: hypothetical protein VH134_14885 [Candidatus Dormibacteraeota bacterium]|jgi:hypothetical protein|nr:hypothetical protein [Candidatus Dormibacteraeota bacterium]